MNTETTAFLSRLVKSQTAAELLGVAQQTMRLAGDRGDIPCYRIDGDRFFDLDDLKRTTRDHIIRRKCAPRGRDSARLAEIRKAFAEGATD